MKACSIGVRSDIGEERFVGESEPPAAGGAAAADGVPRLPLARYRLLFELESPELFRGFAGSAWRGVLGHALKRLVCVTRERKCSECLLYRSCVYTYIFETPPDVHPGKLTRYPAVPHPFVLSVPWKMPAGTTRYTLGLTLFGRAARYLAYMIHALRSAAAGSLRGQPAMELTGVEQETAPGSGEWKTILERGSRRLLALPAVVPAVPPAPRTFEIEFLTPLRLRHRESYVAPERFTFGDLFANLLRRISLLSWFHTDIPLETDFRGLVEAARQVRLAHSELSWQDWTRYSSRQRTKMLMGGLMGRLRLEGDLEPFWPYLWLGQWTHAGKATGMGLGLYRIQAAPAGRAATEQRP